MQGTSPHIEA